MHETAAYQYYGYQMYLPLGAILTVQNDSITSDRTLYRGDVTKLSPLLLPTPSIEHLNEVRNAGNQLWRCTQIIHPGSSLAITWTEYASGDDVSSLWNEQAGTYTFRGIVYQGTIATPASGDVVLLPTGGFKHYGGTTWDHLRTPDGWIGQFATEAEAEQAVDSSNEVAAYEDSLWLVDTYTAASDALTDHHWVAETQANHVLVNTDEFETNLSSDDDNTLQKALNTHRRTSAPVAAGVAAAPAARLSFRGWHWARTLRRPHG